MINYPTLPILPTIGVTAPSSGVPTELHPLLEQARVQMESIGWQVLFGKTVWTQKKAKSSPAEERAAELQSMFSDDSIDLIIPPWGGELLIETLEYIDFDAIKPKWIVGYSDTSLLLLAITLKTGIATAHSTNLVDVRGEYEDETTAMWKSVLTTEAGGTVLQTSSEKFQKKWDHENPSPCVFHLTEQTEWKSIGGVSVQMKGRLLGGCIDIIRHAVGTPYGDIASFRKSYVNDEPIIWFFENCQLTTTDLRRSLVQMKAAGWFTDCAGVMFGRSAANQPVGGYTVEDVYKDVHEELQVPVLFDIDCGHVPPQNTLINGAWAEINMENGKGTILQRFI